MMTKAQYQYEVALSFAGEERHYVEQVAEFLKRNGISFFYDKYEEIGLWGKDLYVHLDEIYRLRAHYCVMFISASYKDKLWTNHERASAQARAFQENEEYLLPARFDDTEIPGIKPTIGYIDLRTLSPEDFASKILIKLGKGDNLKQSTGDTGFRKPKTVRTSFNSYEEALKFIDFLSDELKKRCIALSGQGISLSVFDRDSRKCFRVVSQGETKYSLDVWMGGVFGDASISFYGGQGKFQFFANATNAWGNIIWNKELETAVLELHDLSLLRPLGDTRQYKYIEFLDSLWDKICDVLEERR